MPLYLSFSRATTLLLVRGICAPQAGLGRDGSDPDPSNHGSIASAVLLGNTAWG